MNNFPQHTIPPSFSTSSKCLGPQRSSHLRFPACHASRHEYHGHSPAHQRSDSYWRDKRKLPQRQRHIFHGLTSLFCPNGFTIMPDSWTVSSPRPVIIQPPSTISPYETLNIQPNQPEVSHQPIAIVCSRLSGYVSTGSIDSQRRRLTSDRPARSSILKFSSPRNCSFELRHVAISVPWPRREEISSEFIHMRGHDYSLSLRWYTMTMRSYARLRIL